MGGGFQYLDLIFFGIVAVFVILRLRSVLGKRTGNERRRDPFASAPAKDQPVAARAPNAPMPDIAAKPAIGGPIVGAPVAAGVARIRAADPNFDEGHFIAGARAAFEMIVGAYAAGDAGALRPLLSDEVFANFNRAIEERQKNGHTLSTTLVGIRSAEIIEADLQMAPELPQLSGAGDDRETKRGRSIVGIYHGRAWSWRIWSISPALNPVIVKSRPVGSSNSIRSPNSAPRIARSHPAFSAILLSAMANARFWASLRPVIAMVGTSSSPRRLAAARRSVAVDNGSVLIDGDGR